ncbi:MAG TPA: 3-deoxy-D-manno-octulosonic acid transferase [Candidatus Acidoferrales bacterium]|nr:3-deoxy-D-manno-octulosonic acid transferase [Candidatus Acidoferrales bacterium]
MYAIYSLLMAVGILLLSPYFVVRGLIQKKYLSNLPERFGRRFPPELIARNRVAATAKSIWIHAVSVGEVLAALPLAQRLTTKYPERRLVISTTTVTGQQLARERMPFADAIFFFPMDWRGSVRRALAAVQPAAVIIVETEIWPNFLRECRRVGVPVAFVNGRLSERSFRGFKRALLLSAGTLSAFLRKVLCDATLFLMQSADDAERIIALGAPTDRVRVTGNLKYDLAAPAAGPLCAWLEAQVNSSQRRPVILAGSVLADEETLVLRAFAQVEREFPRALFILAPRKPEQFDNAAAIVEGTGRNLLRRSNLSLNGAGESSLQNPKIVLLLDSIGELASLYRLADAVFVGGSLVPGGGHNILEPAAFGKVPIYGQSMENFREMSANFLIAGAAIQVADPDELGVAWTKLLKDEATAARMGDAARNLVEQNRGATQRVLEQLENVLGPERSTP